MHVVHLWPGDCCEMYHQTMPSSDSATNAREDYLFLCGLTESTSYVRIRGISVIARPALEVRTYSGSEWSCG